MAEAERQRADTVAAEFVSVPTQIRAIRYVEGTNNEAVRQFSVSSAAYYWRELDPEDGEGIYAAEVFDFLHGTWIPMEDGQWVIRGTKGELYPCDDEVFRQKYRPLERRAEHIDGDDDSSGCTHPPDGVMWNEFNKVTQCHRCGARIDGQEAP